MKIHDFAFPKLGKVAPYGVYDISQNRGWVCVGIDHDTLIRRESIRRWWVDKRYEEVAISYCKYVTL